VTSFQPLHLFTLAINQFGWVNLRKYFEVPVLIRLFHKLYEYKNADNS
jgi:hypothetical protein